MKVKFLLFILLTACSGTYLVNNKDIFYDKNLEEAFDFNLEINSDNVATDDIQNDFPDISDNGFEITDIPPSDAIDNLTGDEEVDVTVDINCNLGISYTSLGVVEGYDPSKPPPENNPDYNLLLLGYDLVDEYKGLVFYAGDTDPLAPQFYTIFADMRTPVFLNTYRAHGWDWENNHPLPPPEPNPPNSWAVTVLGIEFEPGEIIYTPDSGYDIQYGYDAMVLFANDREITITYTRNDHIRVGYTIYITGICVESSLLNLYQNLNSTGRHDLPVVRGGQPLGVARGKEVDIAIRDTATFGDPRSCKDFWAGRCP